MIPYGADDRLMVIDADVVRHMTAGEITRR
jgi:hypothetical protein